ncbi:MAG TPA: hypothetical protein VMD09_15970 [Solirubrobacteraceae bacterium]|nr:hypothetical protein [Solirubrobacteraceae bacterium]
MESLDRDDPQGAHAELGDLAERLEGEGYDVDVAGLDAPIRARLQKSGGNVVIDVLQVVLDESERHLIDAVIAAVTSWAIHRRFFAGSNQATPQLVVWVDREIVQTVALPTNKFDILVRVTGVDQAALSRRLERINQSLADGDVVVLQLVGTVPDMPTMYSGSATTTSAGREDAVRRLRATFELAGMTLIRRETAPGGDVPFLHFEASDPA